MNMQKMMKEMQKMQGRMARMQNELAETEFDAEAGGGMVKVVMTGKGDLKEIKLDPDAVDPDDVEALEDLIVAAFSAAKEKIDSKTQEQMGGLTGGMKLPF